MPSFGKWNSRVTSSAGERLVLGGIIVLAGYFGVTSFCYQIGSFNNPQSGFFPLVISLLVLVLAVFLNFFPTRPVTKQGSRCGEPEAESSPHGIHQILSVLAAIGVFTVVLEHLGFTIAAFALLLFLLKVMKIPGWVFPVLFSLIVVTVAWVVFQKWLGVRLPGGFLAF